MAYKLLSFAIVAVLGVFFLTLYGVGGDAQGFDPPCAPGSLDPSFNGTGIVTTSFESSNAYARSVAAQSDGAIVAAGTTYVGTGENDYDFALTRYKSDGTLDDSFGLGGKVTTALSPYYDIAYSVAIQQDGRIIAAGMATGAFALVRYNHDGSLDTSFGTNGTVVTSFSGEAYSVAIQPDGRIVAAGISQLAQDIFGFGVARFNTDGSLDKSFGTDGWVTTRIRNRNGNAYSVAIQPDGRIVAAGQSIGTLTGYLKWFAVIRYNADGTLDTSFGDGGAVTTQIGTRHDEAFSVAIQPDGQIVAAGYSDYGPFNNLDFALVRYKTNGTLDSTFGTGGKVLTEFGSDDLIFSVHAQEDGKIITAGRVGYAIALARYNSDGTLDTSFNGTGKVITSINGYAGTGANSAVLQHDGRIVAAGYAFTNTTTDFAVVRYGIDCTTFTPLPTNTATNTPTPTPTCAPADIILDGGFEIGGIREPIWNNPIFSSNWGTPLCDLGSCWIGLPPRTGSVWAWFGSRDRPETARLGQSVIIPPGTAELHFWMRVGNVTAPYTDVLSVKIDNVTVQTYPEPFVTEPEYTERVIDLSAFANGALHNIKFEYLGPTSGEASFLVDDVSLISVSGCATTSPTNTPTQMPTPPIVSVSVGANVAGLAFTVDSVRFTSPQNFIWGIGSLHTISTSLQYTTDTRYLWENWSDGGAMSHSVTATADTTYTANFRTQYLLFMSGSFNTTPPWGYNFYDAGQTLPLEATYPAGCQFVRWVGTGNGSYTGTVNPSQIVMNGPITEEDVYVCGLTPTATPTFTSTAANTPTTTPTEPPPPPVIIQFSSPTYFEDESQIAAITITRTGNISGTAAAFFTASNATAFGGGICGSYGGPDFINVAGQQINFDPGETSKTVNVTLCGDGLPGERDETVNLSLAGANIGSPSTAVLTINDTATMFQNQANIAINAGGASDLYPSTITVNYVTTILGSLRVTVYDYSTAVPANVSFLLVGPGGQKFILMANADGFSAGGPATLTFSDTAGQIVPFSGPLATGDFEPTSYGIVANFPDPAPSGPYNLPGSTIGGFGSQMMGGSSASTYGGTNPIGTWRLYVREQSPSSFAPSAVVGNIAGGWGIEFITVAAGGSISGRVTTANGQGIRNAKVVITGNSLIEPLVASTGSFGYFRFEGLPTGDTYVVTVNSKRYTFSMPSRVIALADNVVDADFIADPR